MKLIIVLLIAACLQVSAKGYSQIVTLKVSNVPLQKVFEEIRKQTGYQFFYADEALATAKNVTLNIKNKSIQEVLDYCFQNQQLSFTISGNTIIVKRKAIVPDVNVPVASPPAATIVTGRITDDSGQPLEGVTILIKGTSSGTKSDANGNFSIDAGPNTSLVISYVGFETTEVRVDNRSNISVQLKTSVSTGEQVVVIGYGSRSKRDVTTAISTISADKIGKQVPASPELLMQGQMSGVQVIGNQGNPSARPTVRIRGTNTFGVSDPLYVVDGIPIKEWGAGVEGSSDQYTRGGINIMAMIDPNDIESISVLKDASAGAIYGVRASNGVVLITTKKGKKGKASVTYSQRVGVQNLNQKIDLLDTKGYTDFNNALYASDPTSDGSRSPLNEVFRPTNPNYLGNSSTYDWQNEVKNKNAIIQDYSVNVSGGTDKADYYLSFGYSNQEGVYIANNMKRYNGSFKLNVNINQYLRVSINYRLSTAKGRDKTGDIGSLLKTASTPVWQPINDPAGINGYAQVVKGYDNNGVWNNNVLYGSLTRYNMPGYFSLTNDYNSSLRNMGNAYVELEPIKGLKFKGTISIDKFDNTYTGGGQYLSSYFQYDGGDPNALASGSVGDYGVRSIKNYNIVSEFTANYIKSFGNHNIDFLVSAMDQKYEADWSDVGTSYVTSTNPNLINLGGDNLYTRAGGFKKLGALQGFLFRGAYNFANKYYIDATLRRDGSARFAPENRWGTFPAVSVAWRMNKENFMDNASWVNDLKFRAGWGQLGNQEVSDLAYLSTINTAPTYAWGTNPSPRTNNPLTTGLGYTSSGAAVYGMANKDLQWERTTTLNIGFDATMFT
ncbi:MAG TPA: SusC/RagA family TonB-linked outer membrane protein, partial [Flavitalea sp.]|nr:SusC/RagA family TonB-linked outer membrane protein [Flavitalea sp.]